MSEPPPKTALTGDERELIERRTREKVIGQLQGMVGLIATAAAIVALVGGFFIVRELVDGLVEGKLDDWRAEKNRLIAELSKARDEADRAARSAEVQAETARADVARLRREVEAAIAGMAAAAKTATEKNAALRARAEKALAEAETAATSAREAAAQARNELATTEQTRAPIGPAAAGPAGVADQAVGGAATEAMLSANDLKAIRVRQIAEKIDAPDQDGRTWRLLTFTVEVDAETADAPPATIFARIDRVDYVFDRRWFSDPVRTVTSAATRFAYSVRVFGATKVRAVVRLSGPAAGGEREVTREGFMNLFGGGVLGG